MVTTWRVLRCAHLILSPVAVLRFASTVARLACSDAKSQKFMSCGRDLIDCNCCNYETKIRLGTQFVGLHASSGVQIRLYYPETGHPAYGVIRALVKDSTDTSNRGSYTDSDGRVGVDYQSVADGPPAWGRHFLADDLWHMLTLTTLSNNASGLQGYIMSLDGQQMAYQAADQFYAGEQCMTP